MTVHAWLLFCATETLLCLSPGPSSLLVTSVALTQGRPSAVKAATGVLAANACYFALSASGLVAARSLSLHLFLAVKWAGAAYLVWLGLRMLTRSFRRRDADAPSALPSSGRRSFGQGFLTQGANPNLLVYFTAILPQFVDAGRSLPLQVAILAFSSFAIELSVLLAYASLASRAGRIASARSRVLVERLGGGFLVAAGAGLASLRRG